MASAFGGQRSIQLSYGCQAAICAAERVVLYLILQRTAITKFGWSAKMWKALPVSSCYRETHIKLPATDWRQNLAILAYYPESVAQNSASQS